MPSVEPARQIYSTSISRRYGDDTGIKPTEKPKRYPQSGLGRRTRFNVEVRQIGSSTIKALARASGAVAPMICPPAESAVQTPTTIDDAGGGDSNRKEQKIHRDRGGRWATGA